MPFDSVVSRPLTSIQTANYSSWLLPATVATVTMLVTGAACRDDAGPLGAAASYFPRPRAGWNGFECRECDTEAGTVQLIVPAVHAPGKPWVWNSEHLDLEAAANVSLLERGYHVVRLKLPNLFGSPEAVRAWEKCHKVMTTRFGLANKPALVGVSRGALFCYNWATRHPDKVSCIVGDAAVCDLRSWPGCTGKADPSPVDLAAIMQVYAVASVDDLFARALNPIDSLEPLAIHQIPLLHIYGDSDTTVPWQENSGALAERYRRLGGQCDLIVKRAVGHVSGLEDPTPIVEFIDRHCRKTSVR